jgi:hypothetical protein
MSFFKKLTNEFEKLDFGADGKDKRKNEAQSQGSRGKQTPHPSCASRCFKQAVGDTSVPGSPSCPSSPPNGASRTRKSSSRQLLSHFLFCPFIPI